jgi:hypothetical protein
MFHAHAHARYADRNPALIPGTLCRARLDRLTAPTRALFLLARGPLSRTPHRRPASAALVPSSP